MGLPHFCMSCEQGTDWALLWTIFSKLTVWQTALEEKASLLTEDGDNVFL